MKKEMNFIGILICRAFILFVGILTVILYAAHVWAIPVFINEFHYDNTGADVMEFIELAGPSGSLSGWAIVLYNGNNGLAYHTADLTGGEISGQQEINGTFYGTYSYDISGSIQNGSPDGIALVDAEGTVVQFLSYEGILSAVDGPAAGMASTDIGVFEPSSTPVGFSLQLTGNGLQYEDFSWNGPSQNTKDSFNTGQSFSPGESAAVPEPSTLLLFISGLSFLFTFRRTWGRITIIPPKQIFLDFNKDEHRPPYPSNSHPIHQ